VKAGGELGRRRGRLGGVTDGRETGIGLHDDTHGGELRETAITATCSTGRSMGEGRERLTCGGHV